MKNRFCLTFSSEGKQLQPLFMMMHRRWFCVRLKVEALEMIPNKVVFVVGSVNCVMSKVLFLFLRFPVFARVACGHFKFLSEPAASFACSHRKLC